MTVASLEHEVPREEPVSISDGGSDRGSPVGVLAAILSLTSRFVGSGHPLGAGGKIMCRLGGTSERDDGLDWLEMPE